MRRIDLLPPEERRRRAAGPAAPGGMLGILLIVGAVVIVIMVAVYLFYMVRLGNERDRIAELDAEIARQNQRVAELSPYRDLQARLEAKKPVADGIYRTRFPWDQFLLGLSFVIPESTALNSFTGQSAPVNTQAPPDQSLEPPGAITFTGIAYPDYQDVADFVVRMNNLRFLANSKLVSAELDRETYIEPAITFEVSGQLVTLVGQNGNEVRIGQEGPTPGTPADETGAPSEDQASRPGLER